MQALNQALDQMLKQKQANCDHVFQSRIVTPQGTFCGDCNLEEIQ